MVMTRRQLDQMLLVSHTTLTTLTFGDRQIPFLSRSFRRSPGMGMT
jgi:hypothetical protein